MTASEASVIAFVQGATELFPVSSLGHAVILPWLLGWRIDPEARAFLPFLVMLHVGTGVALLAYFWRDWWTLAVSFVGLGPAWRIPESRRMVALIVVATIPAVIVGGLAEHALRRMFASPLFAACFLIANGALLLAGERLRPSIARRDMRPLSDITMSDALAVGCWQCLALLPGLSRSGATIVGGLLRGIDHEAAAHFSFLIAFPVILAATALEVPRLFHTPAAQLDLSTALVCAVVAGVVALVCTAVLMRYFRANDRSALRPFAIYCFVVGGGCVAIRLLGHS